MSGVRIGDQATYWWAPQKDITAFELAQCLGMFAAGATGNPREMAAVWKTLPAECRRHWNRTIGGGFDGTVGTCVGDFGANAR